MPFECVLLVLLTRLWCSAKLSALDVMTLGAVGVPAVSPHAQH